MTDRYRLHFAPDNASLILRLALEELRLPYDTRLVDRARQAQRSAAHRALNPVGQIPVLETPQGPMFETAAILLWLTDRHGGLGPGPNDPGRSLFLSWLFYLSNTVHSDLRQMFFPERSIGPDPAAQQMLRGALSTRLCGHYKLLVTAALPTLRNCPALGYYVATLMRWSVLYPAGQQQWFQLSDYPGLQALAEDLETRAATAAAQRAEGLGPHPFTAPRAPTPPEGVPL